MSLFVLPKQVPVSGGSVYPGGKLYFYATGTTTAQTTYTDSARSVAHSNPVVADSNGVFAPIWLDPGKDYRVQLKSSADVLIYDVDPYPGSDESWYVVSTYAALRALDSPSNGDQAIVTGAGIAGTFVFDSSEGSADDGGTIIAPTDGTTGRWIRRYSGPLSVLWFGAKGDGSTNDTVAIQAALDAAKVTGVTVYVPAGVYIVSSLSLREASGQAFSLVGDGIDNTIFKTNGSTGSSNFILDVYFPKLGDGTGVASGCFIGNFTVDGNARSAECNGMRCDGGNVHLSHIAFRAIDGFGLSMGQTYTARECTTQSLVFRWCGRSTVAGGSSNCAAWNIGVPSSADAETNNIYATNTIFVYPMFAGLHIWGTTGTNGNSRNFYFSNLMLHGAGDGTGAVIGCRTDVAGGMALLEGNISNVILSRGFVTQVGSSTIASYAFNITTGTKSGTGKRITISDFTCDTSVYGGLLNIDDISGTNTIRGLITDGSTNNYPTNHVTIDSSVTGNVYFDGCLFNQSSLVSIPYSIADQITSSEDFKITCSIPADAAAADTDTLIAAQVHKQYWIKSIKVSWPSAVTADGTDYCTLDFKSYPSGGAAATFASRDTSSTSIAAYTTETLTPSSAANIKLSADEQIIVVKSKANAGVTMPQTLVTFSVTPFNVSGGL